MKIAIGAKLWVVVIALFLLNIAGQGVMLVLGGLHAPDRATAIWKYSLAATCGAMVLVGQLVLRHEIRLLRSSHSRQRQKGRDVLVLAFCGLLGAAGASLLLGPIWGVFAVLAVVAATVVGVVSIEFLRLRRLRAGWTGQAAEDDRRE